MKVHTLSPGMVFTQLLLDDSTPELRKFPFGVLAAQPEEVPPAPGAVFVRTMALGAPEDGSVTQAARAQVAADLVPKILANPGMGESVEFLTTDKVLLKLFERFVLQKKSEFIDDDGNVIKRPGQEYLDNGVAKQY